VLRDVFPEHPELGWFIASIYLICGAFRLARFNVLSMQPGGSGREFVRLSIPSAAALVASLTLFIMWVEEKDFPKGKWRFLLPVLLLFLSWMMVSQVRYPSFKSLNLPRDADLHQTLVAILFVGCVVILRGKILVFILPLFFTAYLIYGFVRPRISRAWRREIEDEDEDEPDTAP